MANAFIPTEDGYALVDGRNEPIPVFNGVIYPNEPAEIDVDYTILTGTLLVWDTAKSRKKTCDNLLTSNNKDL